MILLYNGVLHVNRKATMFYKNIIKILLTKNIQKTFDCLLTKNVSLL